MKGICIIDSAFTRHPDLNIAEGRNFTNNNPSEWDVGGLHATHVAGIAGAKCNDRWITGAYAGVPLYLARWLIPKKYEFVPLARAIEWAIEKGVSVINMSLSTTAWAENDVAIKKAHDAGITLVAAAGNSGDNTMYYPASNPNVICVTAVDKNNNKADFASMGSHIDVAYYGVDIESLSNLITDPDTGGDRTTKLSGTSMAAPAIAGYIARYKDEFYTQHSRYPTLEEIKFWLQSHSVDLGEQGKDSVYGFGLFIPPWGDENVEQPMKDIRLMDVEPVILSGRTMLPLRPVLEAFGGTVDFDHASKTAKCTLNGKQVILQIGSKEMEIKNI